MKKKLRRGDKVKFSGPGYRSVFGEDSDLRSPWFRDETAEVGDRVGGCVEMFTPQGIFHVHVRQITHRLVKKAKR